LNFGSRLNSQARQLGEACGSYADLHFVSKDHRNPSLPQSADHCVLMTKFIDHALMDRVIRQYGRENIHQHRGGLSRLVKLIRAVAGASGEGTAARLRRARRG
jgi:hypothetical protein